MNASYQRLAAVFVVASLGMLAEAPATGFVFLPGNPRWPDGQIVMHLQLGSGPVLTDGSPTWGDSAEAALMTWNRYTDRVRFAVVRDSTAAIGDGNNINNVVWSNTVFGRPLGSSTLAVTTAWTRGSTRTEADVIFNSLKSFNSYRGPLTRGVAPVYDFQRVALHEFGHVLGLDHPDDRGQTVLAQMNSFIGDLDTLASDDIAGGRALYLSSFGNGTITFPSQTDTLSFRSQLEDEYRVVLRRSASTSTYVDTTGDAVWTQEYLRYRVNLCSHASAVQRVIDEINGFGTAPVCGGSPVGQVLFPPRTEALDFRVQLEGIYRDGLRRGPNLTAVDNEGDVVWTQEYLRYRVNGCDHARAVTSVFQQIEGRGALAVCR